MKKNVFVILMSLLIGNMVLLLCCFSFLFFVSNEESETNIIVEEEKITNENEIVEAVIIEDGTIISGLEQLLQFLIMSKQKKECEIEVVCKSLLNSYIEKKITYTNGRYIVEEYIHHANVVVDDKILEEEVHITINEYLYLHIEYIQKHCVWLFSNEEHLSMDKIRIELLGDILKKIERQTGMNSKEIEVTFGYLGNSWGFRIHLSIQDVEEKENDSIWGEMVTENIQDDETINRAFWVNIGNKTAIMNVTRFVDHQLMYHMQCSIENVDSTYGTILDYKVIGFKTDMVQKNKSKIALEDLLLEETIYTANQAIEEGCIVKQDGEWINADSILNQFYLAIALSQRSEIRMISYEQDEIVGAMDIVHNKTKKQFEVYLLTDEDTIQEERYKYFKIFSDAYIFTNKESLTEEEWKENYEESVPGVVRTIFRK